MLTFSFSSTSLTGAAWCGIARMDLWTAASVSFVFLSETLLDDDSCC